MFKKILLIALLMIGVGCNDVTAPEETIKVEVPKVQTVTISDTVLIQKKIISGKIVEKNSSGKDIGGLSAIVCSDFKKTCVETNDAGEYYMSFESPIQKVSARFLVNEDSLFDTVETPKKIDTVKVDTVAKIDKIDSTKKDTIKITYRKFVPESAPDTVIVFKDSKKIYEQPITSWLSILPDNYVVQRNISGKIVQNDYFNELKDIEAVFWSLDSTAMVIPLEVNGGNYSGFIYQHYNDSSFKKSIRMFNLFVRILDKSDSVYGLTNVVNYSERAGDLVFADMIPGNIARYPRPNYFRVIKDGSNVSILIDSVQKISTNKKWFALDSLYIRPLYTENIKTFPSSLGKNGYVGEIQKRYVFDSSYTKVAKNMIDSIGFYIDAKEDGNIFIQTTTWEENFHVTKGINFITKPKEYAKNMEESEIWYYVYGPVEKFNIYYNLK